MSDLLNGPRTPCRCDWCTGRTAVTHNIVGQRTPLTIRVEPTRPTRWGRWW